MHRIFAILLLASLHVKPAINATVWLNYLVNTTYIKEVLCINKERPKLQCDGKCHVNKQLKKSDTPQDENKLPVTLTTKIEYIVFAMQKISTPTALRWSKYHTTYYLLNTYDSSLVDVFHPPRI